MWKHLKRGLTERLDWLFYCFHFIFHFNFFPFYFILLLHLFLSTVHKSSFLFRLFVGVPTQCTRKLGTKNSQRVHPKLCLNTVIPHSHSRHSNSYAETTLFTLGVVWFTYKLATWRQFYIRSYIFEMSLVFSAVFILIVLINDLHELVLVFQDFNYFLLKQVLVTPVINSPPPGCSSGFKQDCMRLITRLLCHYSKSCLGSLTLKMYLEYCIGNNRSTPETMYLLCFKRKERI